MLMINADMINADNYRIRKREVNAEILTTGDHMPGEYILFLESLSKNRKTPQTMFQFLNTNNSFIPIKNASTREVSLLNVNEIIYLKEPKESPEFQVKSVKKRVKFILTNDIELEVDHFIHLPKARSRMLDYLNNPDRFIVFYHNHHKTYINKNKILKVKEEGY